MLNKVLSKSKEGDKKWEQGGLDKKKAHVPCKGQRNQLRRCNLTSKHGLNSSTAMNDIFYSSSPPSRERRKDRLRWTTSSLLQGIPLKLWKTNTFIYVLLLLLIFKRFRSQFPCKSSKEKKLKRPGNRIPILTLVNPIFISDHNVHIKKTTSSSCLWQIYDRVNGKTKVQRWRFKSVAMGLLSTRNK